MSSRERQLIGLVLMLMVLLAGYYFLYKPLANEQVALESEIKTMTTEVIALREEFDKIPTYKQGIEDAQEVIEGIVNKYPSDLGQESAFKLLFDLEEDVEDVEFTSVSFSPVQILSYSNENNEASSVTSIVQNVSSSQQLDYNKVKEVLTYLYSYDERTVLQGLTLSLNEEEGLIDMSMNMNMYALAGEGRDFILPTFEQVPKGNEVPFDSKKATVAIETKKNEGQEKDVLSDLFIALKPVQSDIEAQVIGLTTDNIQKSYVKKDINGPVEGILRIYVENNQYYANYDVDGLFKEAQAFSIGTALELDLFAARRLDEFDKVEMNLEIINQTPKTLYINRKEEDYSNPRLKISVTEGLVEFR